MYSTGPENISDKELVDRIKADDTKAYYHLFNRHWELLYSIAQSLLKNSETSKDIVQEVWLSFWERRKEIVNDNIRAYLIQAVKFKVYRELRDNKLPAEQEKYLENIEVPDSLESLLDQKELEQHLQLWIEELPPKRKEVFKLSRFENLSNKEIADQLQLSQRTVETHISHTLKFLREKMKLLTLVVMLLN